MKETKVEKEYNNIKENKAITLIALVITIIVLLLLAGVSIATLTGENGILLQAKKAKEENEKASIIEQAKLDILAWKTEKLGKNEDATLSNEKIKDILTGKDYLKDGMLDDEGLKNKDGEIVFDYSDLYEQEETFVFNPETLEIGDAINSNKYGYKVTGYTKTTEEFTTGVWRLFYQDSDYTYLITDETVGNMVPYDYTYLKKEDGTPKYQSGVDVSIIGQRLNKMLLDAGNVFIELNETANIKGVAGLTDQEIWGEYKNEDAVFAIGCPTIELYKASFNATASENNAIPITIGMERRGYSYEEINNQFNPTYNYGIYSKSEGSFWLASPAPVTYDMLLIYGWNNQYITYSDIQDYSYPVRPIVCIPTSVFDSKYASTLVAE